MFNCNRVIPKRYKNTIGSFGHNFFVRLSADKTSDSDTGKAKYLSAKTVSDDGNRIDCLYPTGTVGLTASIDNGVIAYSVSFLLGTRLRGRMPREPECDEAGIYSLETFVGEEKIPDDHLNDTVKVSVRFESTYLIMEFEYVNHDKSQICATERWFKLVAEPQLSFRNFDEDFKDPPPENTGQSI